jgi:hypothetical protein
MRSEDPRVLAVAAALVALLNALAADTRGHATDELVAFPFGLERRAARALMRAGQLSTTKIGRRVFARHSAILALVGDTPGTPQRTAVALATPAAAARAAYAARTLRAVDGGR